MAKKTRVSTFIGNYTLGKVVGSGGAGRVYGAKAPDQTDVAIKVLVETSTSKRKRFYNEVAFLESNPHPNIIRVLDRGVVESPEGEQQPFYVMAVFAGSLRAPLNSGALTPDRALGVFDQILSGVEAAHLLGVVHRDLKPENILCDAGLAKIVVADFGIAHFAEDLLATAIKTQKAERLANFVYAAPEQRVVGGQVGITADIYALGLILNEMFTRQVPQGEGYTQIGDRCPEFRFLDPLVADMIKQDPSKRPQRIDQVRARIRQYHEEFAAGQRLSEISKRVVEKGAIDDPLAETPLRVVDAQWQPNGALQIFFDRRINSNWIAAFRAIGSYQYVPGFEPHRFTIQEDHALITGVREQDVGPVIESFESWMKPTTDQLRHMLIQENNRREMDEKKRLRAEREAEEARLRVMAQIKRRQQ